MALTGKEELGKEIYNRRRNVHLVRGEKPCEKSFVLAGTLPFVGLDLVVEKYSTLYRAWHLAPPVYFTCLFKAQGQLVCKLAYASDTYGVSKPLRSIAEVAVREKFDGGLGHQVPLGGHQGLGLDIHQDL